MASIWEEFDTAPASVWDEFDREARKRTTGEAVADIGVSAAGGVGSVLEGAGTLYGLATGDMENGLREFGKGVSSYWQERKSPGLLAREMKRREAIDSAEGQFGKAWAAIRETATDPGLLTSFLSEQLPMLVPGMAVGRAAGIGAKALGAGEKVARGTALGAGIGTFATQQGADVGGDTYDRIKELPQELFDGHPAYQALVQSGVSPDKARDAVAQDEAKAATMLSAGISVASMLVPGGTTVERLLVGAGLKRQGAAAIVRGMLGEAAQEAVEEGGGQVAGNIGVRALDASQSLTEGVGEAAGMGGLMGGVFGGGFSAAASRRRDEPAPKPKAPPIEEVRTARSVQEIFDAASAEDAIAAAARATAEEPVFESDVALSELGIIGSEMAPTERAGLLKKDEPAYQQLERAKELDFDRMLAGQRDTDAEAATAASLRQESEARPKLGTGVPETGTKTAMQIAMERAVLARMEGMVAQGTLDADAHLAATSPQNDLPEPTEAQKEAGNYKKGHALVGGLDVSIENPAGSKRRPEWPTLESHYGYIRGVPARAPDKEHVDVFVKPGTAEDYAGDVFVVDQKHKDGRFDEPKVMIGFASLEEAQAGYLRNYTPDWDGIMGITQMPMATFKERLNDPQAFMQQQPDAVPPLDQRTPAETPPPVAKEATTVAEPATPEPKIAGRPVSEMTERALQLAAKGGSQRVRKAAAAELERRVAAGDGPITVPEDAKETLRVMAENSGHLERGGRAIREVADTQTGGDVVGVTRWVGQPEWAKGMSASPQEVKTAVEKAIADKPLGAKQRDVVRAMLEEIEATRANLAEAQALSEAAGPAPDGWSTMTEDEKDDHLDKLFGADTREPSDAQARATVDPEALEQGSAAEEVAGEREPGQDDEASPPSRALEVKQQLFVRAAGQTYPVGSFQEASEKWEEVSMGLMRAGLSPNDTPTPVIVDQNGKQVGYISWNGRVWPGTPQDWKPGREPLYSKPGWEKFKDAKLTPPSAGEPWTDAEDQRLRRGVQDGKDVVALARDHQRTENGIRARMERLGLNVGTSAQLPTERPQARPERPAGATEALAKYDLPADTGWNRGKGPISHKWAAAADGVQSNYHDTAEAAAKELRDFLDTARAGREARERVAAAQKAAADKVRRGENPSFEEWKVAFPQLRAGHTYLRQPDISPFLVEHFGFSKSNIREPLGEAAGTVTSDSGAQYPIVYFNRLAKVLGQARPALDLKGETEAEIQRKAAEKARAEEDKRRRETAPAADDFTLTGSSRPADEAAARGQQDLLSTAANALRTAADTIEKAAKPKAEPKAPTGERIADVGENLWYNRRNFTRGATTWDDVKDLNDALKVKQVVKAKVWPKPDYEELVEQGMEPFIARMLKQVYDGIATAPAGKSDADLERYIAVVGKVREAVFEWAKDANANREFIEKIAERARQSPRSFSISMFAGDNNFQDVLLDRIWPLADSEQRTRRYRFSGNEERTAEARAIGGNRAIKALQFTMDDAVSAMKDIEKGWPAAQEQWQRQGIRVLERKALTVRKQEQSRGEDPLWVIEIDGRYSTYSRTEVTAESLYPADAKWLVVDKRRNVVATAETEEAAKDKARELVKREAKGGDIRGMNVAQATRTGPDRRQPGENVSAERLMEEFGFRGVNFGREGWINQNERQAYLNHAFDGLMDLAELMDVPPKALSLNGMLGIAFGAQGRGGQAAAHFVPGHNEINLTKTMGAGTLAHEWGHALDHYFATQAGLAKQTEPWMSSHSDRSMQTRLAQRRLEERMGGKPPADETRPEIVEAFKAVVETMERRPMTEAEVAAMRQMADKRTAEQLEKWIQHFRKDVERNAPDELAKFDKYAERLRKGDRGEGYVKVGGQILSEPVARIKGLVKNMKGASTNIASNWKGLESNASAVAYSIEQKGAAKEHIPQTTNTQYARESAAKDQGKGGKAYWRTRWEMFARAFETWVASTLAERARENTFLSDAALRAESRDRAGGYAMPYPRGEDRERINTAMGNLVAEIKTRETPRGVAMFKRSDESEDAWPELRKAYEAYDAAESTSTARDLVEEVSFLIEDGRAPESLREPVDNYLEALREDFEEFAGRGDVEGPEDAFVAAVERALEQQASSEAKFARAQTTPEVAKVDDLRHKVLELEDAVGYYNKRVADMRRAAAKNKKYREGEYAADLKSEDQHIASLEKSLAAARRELSQAERALKDVPALEDSRNQMSLFGRADDDGRAYRRSPKRFDRLDVDDVRRIVAPILRNWANAPDVQVIASIAEAPEMIRRLDAQQRAGGAKGEPEAFLHGDTVYLVASAMSSERAVLRALFHESMGHFGLRGVLGQEIEPVLHEVLRSLPQKVNAKAREYGLNVVDQDQAMEAAEEVLAEMAQTMPKANIVQRAIAAIRRWLRKMGVDLKLSDNDVIVNYILPARRFVERGGRGRRARGGLQFERQRPWFYSELTRRLEGAKRETGTAAEWKAMIGQLQGVKKDEIEWSGINEHLDIIAAMTDTEPKGPVKVTKAMVLDFLSQNGVLVDEKMLGGGDERTLTGEMDQLRVELDALGYDIVDDAITEAFGVRRRSDDVIFTDTPDAVEGAGGDTGLIRPLSELPQDVGNKVERYAYLAEINEDPYAPENNNGTRYSQYTLPGGKNYRELLLTLPRNPQIVRQLNDGTWMVQDHEGSEPVYGPDRADALERFNETRAGARDFQSTHFDAPNILAHVRFDERTDADGKRVLFVEEFQSDWAQKGKREGFAPQLRAEQIRPESSDAAPEWRVTDERGTDYGTLHAETSEEAIRYVRDTVLNAPRDSKIPPAPFVGKTEAWLGLALKRVIAYAAENGFDRVAWTTGEQQADRYSLSKAVLQIDWGPLPGGRSKQVGVFLKRGNTVFFNVRDGKAADSNRPELNGKPIEDIVGKKAAEEINSSTEGTLEDEGLKIGGEGMLAFYDKIVPNVANDVLKKLGGGRVGTVALGKTEGTEVRKKEIADAAVRYIKREIDAGELIEAAGLEGVATEQEVDAAIGGYSAQEYPGGIRRAATIFAQDMAHKAAGQKRGQQPGFDITPALRDRALQGLPLFSRRADEEASLRRGAEYEGRLWGGAYSASRISGRMVAKDSPMRAAIIAARKSYNEIRKQFGLEPVTDWTSRPEQTLEQRLRASLDARAAGSRSTPWPTTGDTVVSTSVLTTAMKAHKDYAAAKAGDRAAADRLVQDLFRPVKIREVRQRIGADAYFVPVIAKEAAGDNAIPAALAEWIAFALNTNAIDDVVQANQPHHTGAKAMERLIARPVFDGKVEAGRKYALVDDVTLLGGTLSELADHIQKQGGVVAGAVVLVNASRSATMVPGKGQVRDIERRYGDEVRELFGIEPAALNRAEATYILGFRDAQSLRDRAAAAKDETRQRLESRALRQDGAPEAGLKASRRPATDTPEFKRWFGNSKVVDAEGKPLMVYRGLRQEMDERGGVQWWTDNQAVAGEYAGTDGQANVVPAYLKLENPFMLETDAQYRKLDKWMGYGKEERLFDGYWSIMDDPEAVARVLKERGYDGMVMDDSSASANHRTYVTFDGEQAKSPFNRGTFDASNPDIRFSRAPAWVEAQSSDTQEALRKAGVYYVPPSLKERVASWKDGWQKRVRHGMFDQFDPIKEYDYKAYMLARMTRSADAALEAVLNYGTVRLDADGAVDVNFEHGGFLGILRKLHGEHDRFLAWVIGNRAERLLAEGREHNFTPQDIERLKALSQGKMRDGSARPQLYAQIRMELDRYNKSVLNIAERAGLIDGASRSTWEKDFYVPFYRIMEEDGVKGPIPGKGLVNQYAFKVLKGGEQALGDPLENVLRNWSHLLDASLKNQAARESLLAAERVGAAMEADEDTAKQIAKTTGNKRGAVSFVDGGVPRWFVVEDPFLLDALRSIGFMGFSGPAMKTMQKFKRWLTLGVTVSPTFRIRNVIRDSLSMIGANPASYNVLGNVMTGWKATKEGTPEYASIIAGGGVMRFGTLLEGDRAEHVKRLIEAGVDRASILDKPNHVKAMLQKSWDWWQHVGDRAENVNRAALYKKLRAEGMTHLEASYRARDIMDFSMQGTWAAVRFLTQTVPFMNARMQGLYKLGRGAQEDPRRFGIVLGATALASLALLMAYQDDDDWKAREDWDRETFWWFKIGDTAYRIPKPFEIGAIASLVERGFEAMATDELTGKEFASRVFAVITEQLSLNPVPQLVKPMIEVWSNRDFFTDRPIESMGMERLSPERRAHAGTSATAQLLGKNGLISPVQIDHLVRGYFGWLGSHVIATADLALRPAMGMPEKPEWRVDDVLVLGDFARSMPAYQSKYVTRLYDQIGEVQEAMADLRHLQQIGAMEEAREHFEKNRDKIRLYKLYSRAQRQLQKINKQISLVQRREGSAAEKRERLDALYGIRNRLALLTEERARGLE